MKYLAYGIVPEPDGKKYFESDLKTEEQVVELLKYCRNSEAVISPAGWAFLTETFGMQRMFKLTKANTWMNFDTFADFEAMIKIEIDAHNGICGSMEGKEAIEIAQAYIEQRGINAKIDGEPQALGGWERINDPVWVVFADNLSKGGPIIDGINTYSIVVNTVSRKVEDVVLT